VILRYFAGGVWRNVTATGVSLVLLVGSLCFVCGESTTLYWLKGVVGVFNYRERSEYV
jgi:hypothetical protein